MKVLILGRTNVGKSSLFNRLSKKKKALVFDESGITRDVLKSRAEWWGHEFLIMDSGGLPDPKAKDELSAKIKEKIDEALEEANALIVVADGKAGPLPEDALALDMARKTNKPFLLFVNKVDNPKETNLLTADFFRLSGELQSGSLEKNYGVDEIVEWIIAQKKSQSAKPPSTKKSPAPTELFVIGKANSGKSLLCNRILSQNRMIVCSKAGTTLDTVREFFSRSDGNYLISDNPGSRRGDREEREKLSFSKSRSELKKADIALLVVDSSEGPSRQDTRLVQLCLEKKKPIILILNKRDLLAKQSAEERALKKAELKRAFHFFPDLSMVYLSAKTGYHKENLFKIISEIKSKMEVKIPTSELNKFFSQAIRKAPAPVWGASDVKFYYIVQTNKKPPGFIAFANYPQGVTPAYRRFVVNRIKEKWDLKGLPIDFHVLPRK